MAGYRVHVQSRVEQIAVGQYRGQHHDDARWRADLLDQHPGHLGRGVVAGFHLPDFGFFDENPRAIACSQRAPPETSNMKQGTMQCSAQIDGHLDGKEPGQPLL